MNLHKLLTNAVGGTSGSPVDLHNVLMKYEKSYYHLLTIRNSHITLKSLGVKSIEEITGILFGDFSRWYESQNVLTLYYDTQFTPLSARMHGRLGGRKMVVIECAPRRP